jgi:D-tyrosyl-tRNA(Tyr) deacylase
VRILLQRVRTASVSVDGRVVGSIGPGLVPLVGVGHGDDDHLAERLANKVVDLRVFEDDDGKMNRSLRDLSADDPSSAGVLVVSQFTLYADVRKGRRPGFTNAAPPEIGRALVDRFAGTIKRMGISTQSGEFGAHMLVSLENDGPVTIWIDSRDLERS